MIALAESTTSWPEVVALACMLAFFAFIAWVVR